MKLASACQTDVVIDTNVFSHADNPAAPLARDSLDVLMWLQLADVLLVLDNTGKGNPAGPSTSLLATEYQNTLSPQGFALTLITSLLSTGRCKFVKRPAQATAATIRSLVPNNSRDRAVLGAACGAQDGVLVSNDYQDFTIAVRTAASTSLAVAIVDSSQCDCT